MTDAPDNLSRAGAEVLADKLRAYWLESGYDVHPVVRPTPGKRMSKTGWETLYAVDLPGFVNGWPPRSARIARKA